VSGNLETRRSRVLIVDDEEPMRRQLARFLTGRGYAVCEAASGVDAMDRIRDLRPALMLLDLGMPGMPGTDVIPEALDLEPDLGIVILSGAQDAPTVTTCLQRGALDYLTKPVTLDALEEALERALRRRDTLAQERALAGWVKREVSARTQELERGRERERELAVGALEALVMVLEAKSAFLAGHSTRVAEFAANIAAQLGLSDDDVERIRVAGRLHDVGMIGVREAVLDKRAPLTPEEYAEVRQHPVIGARILDSLAHLGDAPAFVRGHHERWDGTGYPDGLAGEAIPLGARVLHAAEVYDALSTPRPYQEPLPPQAAVERMEDLAGAVLDPGVVAALRVAVGRRRTLSFVATEVRTDAEVVDTEVVAAAAPAGGAPPGGGDPAATPAGIPGADVEGLERAREAAEAASRAKSAFLATITHEMRTPMNGVLGMAEILLGTPMSAEQQEAVELIRASATGLLSLINDVLDFSRIEAGHVELDDQEFDLGAAARSVAALLAPRASDQGVTLACRVAPDVPTLVRGDPGRVRQVITNLVGNAVKFTHEGEIAVQVTAEAHGLSIVVRDTGIGIPADRLPFIFDEFHQVDAGRARRYGGSGLGLSIAQRLVEAMGGTLEAFSTVGVGSEFRVHLPLRRPQAPAPAAPVDPTVLHEAHVLVVADDAPARAGLTRRLAAAGARADATEGPAAAVGRLRDAAAAGDPFRAVLVDLQFGGRSGFALAEVIRRDPGLSDPSIVLLMPAGLRGDAQRCRDLGVDAYLTKPASLDDVLRAVAEGVARPAAPGPRGPLITQHSLEAGRPALRVLLAEDVVINQKVARQLLAQRGHHVDVVIDGEAAVAAVRDVPYDVVLMDVGMPVMDGIEATREIRRDPRFATLPIVAVTAHALESDRSACLEAGMNTFLAKPFRPAELFAVVERFAPPASSEGAPPVDVAGLRAMLAEEDMASLTDELLATFQAEAPGRYAAVRTAVELGDRTRIADAAHALKSSAGAIRAGRLAASLRELELAAREGAMDIGGLANDVEAAFERCMGYLRDVGSVPPPT